MAEYPTKLGETAACGNSYNPLTLWLFLPQGSLVPLTRGDLGQRSKTRTRSRKTLPVSRNLVRTVGLQRIWVP
jgi:hypothetical protein